MSQYKAYPKYKDSGIEWIGQVPEHWEVKRLRHVAIFNNSNVDKKSYEDQEAVRLCNYTDVYYNEFITSKLDFMVATASHAEIEKFRLKKGDVIITKDSEDPRDIGIPSLVLEDMADVICGYHLTVIKANNKSLSGFIHRSIMAHPTKAHFFVESPGITRFGLNQDAIGNIPVCMPPEDECIEITENINTETARIDALIEKKTRFIELLKEKRQALITHAVTKGLDPNVPMKDSGIEWIGQMPEHWGEERIFVNFLEVNVRGGEQSELLAVSQQYGVMPQKEYEELLGRRLSAQEKGDYSNYKRVVTGDLVYNKMRMWQGAIGIVPCEGIVSPAYVAFRPRDEFAAQYWHWLFKSNNFLVEVNRNSQGICDDQNSCNYDEFRTIRVPIPPAYEQTIIVNGVNAETLRIDALIEKTKQSITLLKERRAAFITAAVTGQIDLRGEH